MQETGNRRTAESEVVLNVRRNIVFIAAPQGAAGGGMGRVKDYIIEAAPSTWPDLRALHLVTRDESTRVQSLLLLLKALRTILRHRREILLVHVNIGDKGSAFRKSVVTLFSRLLGLPVVLHLHAVELEQMPATALTLLGLVFRSATSVVVLGERYRRWVIERLGVKPERAKILWNGVPVEAPPRRVHADGKTPLDILFLGSLGQRKGTHDLLAALAALPADVPDWRMTFAGPGDIDAFQAKAAELGIGERCRFTGWLDQSGSREVTASADIMVLPSYHEGLPLVILEALGLGTPVVTTPVGVIPEVLTDGQDVLFCQPGDVPALADRIAALLRDSGLRQSLSDNGLALYQRRFSLASFSASLSDIWQASLPTGAQPIMGNQTA